MQYLIIALIAIIVIYILFKVLWEIVKALWEIVKLVFEFVLEFVKTFPYFCISAVLVISVFFVKGLKPSLYTVAILIGIKIVETLMISISNGIRRRRVSKLKKYLNEKYSNAGYITQNDIISCLPNRYNKRYPDTDAPNSIIKDFLENQTERAYKLLLALILEDMAEKGMDDKQNVSKDIRIKFNKATFCIPYELMFDKAIDNLVEINKIDLPTDDKRAIHLIGASEENVSNMTQVDYSDKF